MNISRTSNRGRNGLCLYQAPTDTTFKMSWFKATSYWVPFLATDNKHAKTVT